MTHTTLEHDTRIDQDERGDFTVECLVCGDKANLRYFRESIVEAIALQHDDEGASFRRLVARLA